MACTQTCGDNGGDDDSEPLDGGDDDSQPLVACTQTCGDDDSQPLVHTQKKQRYRSKNDKFTVQQAYEALSPLVSRKPECHEDAVLQSKLLDFTTYPHKKKRGTAGCIQIFFGFSFLGADIFVLKMWELRCWC